MIKKLFIWTPRDIAYWEKLRQKGLRYFVRWYGVVISGGFCFILGGLFIALRWLKQVMQTGITPASWISLGGQLMFVAFLCLLAGVVNSLITWVIEEHLYHKSKAASSDGIQL